MNFLNFCLLNEAIQSPDIIDIYILMSMPEPADEANRFIKKEIISRSSRTILDEIDNILLREIRHMGSARMEDYMEDERALKARSYDGQDERKQIIKDLTRFQREFGATPTQLYKVISRLHDTYGSEHGNRYLKAETNLRDINIRFGSHITHQDIVRMFSNPGYWEQGYGGKSWAKIAEFAVSLNQSVSNSSEFLKRLDRFVDFVHNNGAVANKFRGFHEGWLLYILDLKQHAVNIRELIPYASRDVQKMFRDINWQELSRKIPGGGAATSFGAYKTLIQKYIGNYFKIHGSSNRVQNITKIGNMVQKIGYDEIVKLLRQAVPKKALQKIYDELYDDGELIYDEDDPSDSREFLQLGANAIDAALKTHPGP